MEFFLSRYKTQFFQGWGMTELSPNGSVGRLDVKREHASWTREEQFSNVQKAGLLHPGLEARIIDVNCGSRCSHDELVVEDGIASGELIVRGPYVTQEYFNHPTSTEDVSFYFHVTVLAASLLSLACFASFIAVKARANLCVCVVIAIIIFYSPHRHLLI